LRQFRKDHAGEDMETVFARQKQSKEEADVVDANDVADKFSRLVLRSAASLVRARQMTKLLNADITIGDRSLKFRGGQMNSLDIRKRHPWQGADLSVYDRMSILLSRVVRDSLTVSRL
jgi:hypothetical protein